MRLLILSHTQNEISYMSKNIDVAPTSLPLKSTTKKLKKLYNLVLRKIKTKIPAWPACLEPKKKIKILLGASGYRHLSKLIQHSSNKKEALLEASVFLANTGLPDYAVKTFESYLELEPESPIVHHYLQTLMYTTPEIYDHKYVYDAHVKWGNTLQSYPKYTSYPNQLTQNRKLKIGYTCHFITNSTSSTLLLPILKAHNKDNVEVFMYSDQDPAQTSEQVRNLVEHWRDTYGLDDEAFCNQVRKDQIDILLELNGHCIPNRYRALTRKPAPIQVNYYNYSSTCGVPGIDYYLAGEELQIDYLQPYYSEKIFHKKGIVIATPISDHFPDVNPPPVLKNGYITFGSFGQAHKVSREQIQLWCEVLKQVPNSRFYMKASALDFPISRTVFENHFSASGIDMNRITLEGASDYAILLTLYSNIDIALDTYPFGGGTTTVEATLQGVPVISLIGERVCSWHGYCNLHNIGHDEFICSSKSEFIRKAVELAGDHQRLIHYRHSLRDDLIRSPRGDLSRFISELENAYSEMWGIYLGQQMQIENTRIPR